MFVLFRCIFSASLTAISSKATALVSLVLLRWPISVPVGSCPTLSQTICLAFANAALVASGSNGFPCTTILLNSGNNGNVSFCTKSLVTCALEPLVTSEEILRSPFVFVCDIFCNCSLTLSRNWKVSLSAFSALSCCTLLLLCDPLIALSSLTASLRKDVRFSRCLFPCLWWWWRRGGTSGFITTLMTFGTLPTAETGFDAFSPFSISRIASARKFLLPWYTFAFFLPSSQ